MNKKLREIAENLSKLKEKYPELKEKMKEGGEIGLPGKELRENLTIRVKDLLEFLETFYDLKLTLMSKKQMRKPRKQKKGLEILPGEEWKEVGRYKVSNLGRVVNWKDRLVSVNVGISGFCSVFMDSKPVMLHTLVARLFVRKVKNKNYVTHVDGNKLNNQASNLKWVDYASSRQDATPGISKGEVYKYSMEGVLLEKYKSTVEASKKSGVNQSNLSKCLRASGGAKVKYKNYLWERHP